MSSAEAIIEQPKTNATGKGRTPPAARINSEHWKTRSAEAKNRSLHPKTLALSERTPQTT